MVFVGHWAAFDVFPLYVFNASHCVLINIGYFSFSERRPGPAMLYL